MKLLNCALVALALSGTGCGSQSSPSAPITQDMSLSPQVLQVSGTVRYLDGTAVGRAKVSAGIGESTVSSTLCDPAGRFVIVVRANGASVTLRASEPPPTGTGEVYAGTRSGIARVEGSTGRVTIDIVLDRFDPI